ncbi:MULTISPECIES: hypothetical protein [Methanobrevibacter]|uniref:hypothetical protein n=1 Tax=Methanobrevibacter TaxID=2172 RepID=UPI00084C545C|nr:MULTISPECIES: hypothetical protein [Methanobrevibacter]OEC97835.1 hypothetical protein A9505_05155 [Methanobrevibacter sp. A27]
MVEKDFDKKIYPQLILPIESILDDNYFFNNQGNCRWNVSLYCKHLGSKKFSRKGYKLEIIILWMMEFQLELNLSDISVKKM